VIYTLKKKFLSLMGSEFSIIDSKGEIQAYAKQKAFKLKEEINIFKDKAMKTPYLQIKARNIIDFQATYDISDISTNELLGALQRQGVKSMFRDEWHIINTEGKQIGIIQEESKLLAFFRRFISNIIPQKFDLRIGEVDAGGFQQAFNPILFSMEIDVNEELLDKRIAFAAAVMLGAVEGRQR